MLHLGIASLTLAPDLQKYYEGEAERPEVSTSMDRYYRHTTPARIHVLDERATSCTANPGDIAQMLEGRAPGSSGEPISSNAGVARRRAGTDMTLSADKTLSALRQAAALAGHGELVAGIDAAFDAARDEMWGHVHELGLVKTRAGKGGIHRTASERIYVADIPHDVSRTGDPQTHAHRLLMNAGLRDGRPVAIDPSEVVEHKFYLQAVASAALARHLRSLGLAVEEVGQEGRGRLRVAGVPEAIVTAWSKRRQQLEAAWEEGEGTGLLKSRKGSTGQRAREIMDALAAGSRSRKDLLPTAAELEVRHRAELAAAGTSPEGVLAAVRAANPAMPPANRDVRAFALQRLFEGASVVHDRQIRTAVAEAAAVLGWTAQEIDEEARALTTILPELGERDGRAYYTSTPAMELERGMLRAAYESRGRGVIRRGSMEGAIREVTGRSEVPIELSDEQVAALHRVTMDGVAVIPGAAGADMAPAREALTLAAQRQGMRVTVVAGTSRAAAGLNREAGADGNSSIQGLRCRIEARADIDISPTSLLVIEEAGTVEMRDAAVVITEARRLGAPVVLLGGGKQISPTGAGAPMRLLQHVLGNAEPAAMHRQTIEWQRVATDKMAAGDSVAGLRDYDAHGRVLVEPSRDAALARIVRDYEDHLCSRPAETRVVVSVADGDVHLLNERLRAVEIRAGRVCGPEITVSTYHRNGGKPDLRPLPIREGDVLLNWATLKVQGLRKGERFTVTAVRPAGGQPTRLAVRTDAGERLTLSVEDLVPPRRDGDGDEVAAAPYLQHAYAVTNYDAKKLAVDRSLIYGAGGMVRHATCLALTRHRLETSVYFDGAAAMQDLAGRGDEPTREAVREHLIQQSRRDIGRACVADFVRDRRAWAYGAAFERQDDLPAPPATSRAERLLAAAEAEEHRLRMADVAQAADVPSRPGEAARWAAVQHRVQARAKAPPRPPESLAREQARRDAAEAATRRIAAEIGIAAPPSLPHGDDNEARRLRERQIIERAYERRCERERRRVERHNDRLRMRMAEEMRRASSPSTLRRIGWRIQRYWRELAHRFQLRRDRQIGRGTGWYLGEYHARQHSQERRGWYREKLEALASSREPDLQAIQERWRVRFERFTPPDRREVEVDVGDARRMEFHGRLAEARMREEKRNERILPDRLAIPREVPELLTFEDLATLRRIGGERAVNAIRLRGLEREGEGPVKMRAADLLLVLRRERLAEEERIIVGLTRTESRSPRDVRAWLEDQVGPRGDRDRTDNRQLADAIARIQALDGHAAALQAAMREGRISADSAVRARDPHRMSVADLRQLIAAAAAAPRLFALQGIFDGTSRPAAEVAAVLRVVRRVTGDLGQGVPGSTAAAIDKALLRLRDDAREGRITRGTPIALVAPSTPAWRKAVLEARSAAAAGARRSMLHPDPSATLLSLAARGAPGAEVAVLDRAAAQTEPAGVPAVPARPAPKRPTGLAR
ncbi:MobF family relaxase [Roseomonas sp. GCM10028921]